jgi:3-oxoacyl-[acyl-carrier protein] reductase
VRSGGAGMTAGEFDGQTFVVVGAASGIGRAAARLLASRHANVLCVDVDVAGAQAVAAELTSNGLSAVAAAADVTDAASFEDAVDFGVRRWGALHGLVNCAGITGETGKPTHEVALDDFDRVVAINLRGALVASRAVLPHLLERGYGRVLHVASIAGKEGNAGMVAYSATKAGLIGMVKAMGKEYADKGITVNALAPAVIWTPLVEQMPEAQVQYMTSRIPMGRLGTLEEVAEMIAFIVSPVCSFTTGFTFDMSGGRATY